MQRRAREDLEASLQYASGSTDSGLVLIEALRGGIMAHADIDPMRAVATVRVIQQDQVDVRAAFTLRLEAGGDLIGYRQPIHVTHGQPFRDGGGRPLPEPLQGR